MSCLDEVFKDKKITESSKKLYCSNLKRLNSGQEIKDFKFCIVIRFKVKLLKISGAKKI